MRVSRGEWRRVFIYAVVLAFLTLVPYLIGWIQAGDDWSFNGFTFGIDDGNAYLGKMRIGAEGDWKFYLFYTSEEHDPAFGLYLPHILVGQLVRIIDHPAENQIADALAIAFQIWRIVGCIALVLATYAFIAMYFRRGSTRWFALVLATLGGGLGWLLILLGQTKFLGTLPVDFYIPEGFSFLILYGLPHIAIGRAALLLGLVCVMLALRTRSYGYVIFAGLCWNIVGLMVTFYLAVIYVILGVWGLALWIRWRRFPLQYALMGGMAAGLTTPLFLYNAWLFQSNDAFSQWSSQNYLPSPNPIHYLIGYAILGGFAIVGGGWAWKRAARPDGEPYALLVGWVLVTPILVYLPLNVQRRLAEGFFIPLVILAVAGMKLCAAWLWRRRGHLRKQYSRLARYAILLLLPSTILFWLISIPALLTPSCDENTCLFRLAEERVAMDWLQQESGGDAVVLSSFRTGNYLPIYTDLRPVYGHGPETLYSDEKKEQVKRFYRGEMSTLERDEWLKTLNVDYIWWGKLEHELGESPMLDGFTMIYDNNGYVIFEVGD